MTVRPFRLLDHPAALLGLAALALHLWVNGSYGYFRDELYFIICGRHPAWGYTDQPPLIAADRRSVGRRVSFLRGSGSFRALAAAATVALTASSGQMLGGRPLRPLARRPDRPPAAARCLLGRRSSKTDTLEPLAWLTVAICVIRAEKDGEPRWWLAAGAIGGIAFLAKYTVAALPASQSHSASSPRRSAVCSRGGGRGPASLSRL